MKNKYIPHIKVFAFFCLITVFSLSVSAQVGIGTTSPNGGSMLDVESANKGVLIPRVNIANLNTLAPVTGGQAEGMLVYNTNTTTGPGFFYWNSNTTSGNWIAVTPAAVDAWELGGNAGTDAANDFIGTTDNQPLAFRVNDTERMGILTNGNVGIGGYYANVKLNVTGGTNTYGLFSTSTVSGGRAVYAETDQDNGLGIMAINSSTNSSTGIVGIGNNSGLYSVGAPGTGIAGTAGENGYGVIGTHYDGSNTHRFGILGSPNSGVYSNFDVDNYGFMNSATEGLYTQRNNNNYY